VKDVDLLAALKAFYREKESQLQRHIAGARLVYEYEFNNAYQYVIAREETQLAWVRDAIVSLGGTPPDPSVPAALASGSGEAAMRAVIEDDARSAQAFVDQWTPRVAELTNDRHRKMLQVILGETLEQKRFFVQALAGRRDLLGRRPTVDDWAKGKVLPTRWVE
jgi:hypothetical protein